MWLWDNALLKLSRFIGWSDINCLLLSKNPMEEAQRLPEMEFISAPIEGGLELDTLTNESKWDAYH